MLIDNAGGEFATKTIYSDNDVDKLESLAPTQPHRNVDLEIVKADQDGSYNNMEVSSYYLIFTSGQVMRKHISLHRLPSTGLPLVNWSI